MIYNNNAPVLMKGLTAFRRLHSFCSSILTELVKECKKIQTCKGIFYLEVLSFCDLSLTLPLMWNVRPQFGNDKNTQPKLEQGLAEH